MNKQIIHDALVLTAFTLVIGVILGAELQRLRLTKPTSRPKKKRIRQCLRMPLGSTSRSMMRMPQTKWLQMQDMTIRLTMSSRP
mgnify:CR=1 FL=1